VGCVPDSLPDLGSTERGTLRVARSGEVGVTWKEMPRTVLLSCALLFVPLSTACDDSGNAPGTDGANEAGGTGGREAETGGSEAGNAAGRSSAGAAGADHSTGGAGNAVVTLSEGGSGHDCPDSLVHPGSAPGILCDDPGSTCADADHFCECGELSFEGAPWACVPTVSVCPAAIPEAGTACDVSEPCHFVREGSRLVCSCEAAGWSCADAQAFCPVWGVSTGDDCEGHEGQSCDWFQPGYPDGSPAMNVPCACSVDGSWVCAEI
jgi:hypothetical protein